eukprot:gene31125-41467_t
MIVVYAFAALLGYALGSIPFGLVLTRLAGTLAASAGFAPGNVVCNLPGYQLLDSLAVEAGGKVCVATIINGGITAFDPSGSTEHYAFPDLIVTNICFGGPDMMTAWITASATGKLFKARWPRPGLKLNFNGRGQASGIRGDFNHDGYVVARSSRATCHERPVRLCRFRGARFGAERREVSIQPRTELMMQGVESFSVQSPPIGQEQKRLREEAAGEDTEDARRRKGKKIEELPQTAGHPQVISIRSQLKTAGERLAIFRIVETAPAPGLAMAPEAGRGVVFLNLLFLLSIIMLPATNGLYGNYRASSVVGVIYGLHLTVIAALNALLWLIAASGQRHFGVLAPAFFPVLVFLVGTAVALVQPEAAQFVWSAAFAAPLLARRRPEVRDGSSKAVRGDIMPRGAFGCSTSATLPLNCAGTAADVLRKAIQGGRSMKKIFLSSAMLIVSSVAATAADLPAKAPLYKAPVAVVYDWTGFYLGGYY